MDGCTFTIDAWLRRRLREDGAARRRRDHLVRRDSRLVAVAVAEPHDVVAQERDFGDAAVLPAEEHAGRDLAVFVPHRPKEGRTAGILADVARLAVQEARLDLEAGVQGL